MYGFGIASSCGQNRKNVAIAKLAEHLAKRTQRFRATDEEDADAPHPLRLLRAATHTQPHQINAPQTQAVRRPIHGELPEQPAGTAHDEPCHRCRERMDEEDVAGLSRSFPQYKQTWIRRK